MHSPVIEPQALTVDPHASASRVPQCSLHPYRAAPAVRSRIAQLSASNCAVLPGARERAPRLAILHISHPLTLLYNGQDLQLGTPDSAHSSLLAVMGAQHSEPRALVQKRRSRAAAAPTGGQRRGSAMGLRVRGQTKRTAAALQPGAGGIGPKCAALCVALDRHGR